MNYIKYLFILLVIFSCNETSKPSPEVISEKVVQEKSIQVLEKEVEEEEKIEVEKNETNESFFSDYTGYYVGYFFAKEYGEGNAPSYSNRINISLDSIDINNGILFGHSVVAGNIRPFQGPYVYDETNQSISANVNEPGDDKYDGVFKFEVFTKKNTLKGRWQANDKNLSVTGRSYKLFKKEFKYNPNLNVEVGEYGMSIIENQNQETGDLESITNEVTANNASLKELDIKVLENLHKGDLEVIRNLIYARHGYSFKNRRMRYFFDINVDWYIPVSTDVRNELTELEVKNIALIKRYEEHAQKYYDYFGR